MLPASYSSRADAFSREGDLSVSHRMKKFYKPYHSGENAKIDDRKYKLKNSITTRNIGDIDDSGDSGDIDDNYNIEKLFDSNGEIENPDGDTERANKKEYKPLTTSMRNIKYPFSDAVSKHSHQDIDFLDEIRFENTSEYREKDLVIEICVYRINTNAHKPFLEFMLYKSSDDGVMVFPNFIYDDTTDGILEKSEAILGNILNDRGLCDFKGRISRSEIENDIAYADIDNRIILLFELKITDTDVVHITQHEFFWWTTVSEIFNYKKLLVYEISNTVTDVFMSCVDMIKIYYKQSLIETPGVFYNGNNKNISKYNAILSLNKSPTESRYGPYYYFTDLHTSMKYACYDADNKKREDKDGAGIVRFIVFHGKMKMFMKTDKIDDSKMATYIFERYPVEKKTGQFRDNDCIWTEGYNSAYNGYHNIQYYTRETANHSREHDSNNEIYTDSSDDTSDNDEVVLDLKHTLESETYVKTKKKRVTIILAMRLCIDEYSFQTPLSYHYINIDGGGDGVNIPKVYDYNFKDYKLI